MGRRGSKIKFNHCILHRFFEARLMVTSVLVKTIFVLQIIKIWFLLMFPQFFQCLGSLAGIFCSPPRLRKNTFFRLG